MSGDVQPRKRKDKKKKKDELGVEEPRGTAAALGEGDVFLHSHQDHGTGGHWCAKIIFFSLLAVLITLIGLIILENRGLSELEANSVESRYSGVLEGWLEDTTDDDHHDAHTLELKHHDDDDQEHGHDDEHKFDHDDDDEDEERDNDFDHNEDDEQTDDDENNEQSHDDHDEDDEDQEDEDREDPDVNDNDEDDLLGEDSNEEDAGDEEGGVGSFRKYFGFGYGGDKDEENTETKSEEENGNDENEEEGENTLSNELNNNDDENDEDEDNDDENKLNEEDDISKENTLSNELNNDDDDKNDEDEDNDDEDKLNEEDDLSKENAYDNSFENFEGDGNNENDDDDNTLNNYNEKDEDDHDEHEDDDDDDDEDTEVERIEREVSGEEPISMELPAFPEDEDDHDKDEDEEDADDEKPRDENDKDDDVDPDDDDEEDDFLEADDEPPIERITAPSGSPFDELEEDDMSTEKPPDTLKEEEEYEKKQEELRQEQEQSSHMWLKLVVGVALLAATYTVMRRATAPPDETESDEHISREETPVVDRRMTLIPVPEEPSEPEVKQKVSKPVEEVVKKTATALKYAPLRKENSEEEEGQEDEEVEMEEQEKADEKELFSEDEPEDEPEQEEEIVQARKEKLQQVVPTVHEPTPDDELDDDVEIIDDEKLEEECEDEEDDEEISDVDDAELLTRLEAKYGRLPEPDRPAPKHKDGGNSLEDEWPGEPTDSFWRQQLDSAERDLRQGEHTAARRTLEAPALAGSARARWLLARALDADAEARRDNRLLSQAIAAYLHLLKMNERLSDEKLLMVADRTLERIQFRGNYLSAEPVYRLLIRRFPDDITYRNKLTVSYLMANRPDLADETLKETLRLWPNDRVALAHYGFVLKTQHNKLEEAVAAFQEALEGDQGPACEPRFYYHLGDALLLLGRFAEAHEVHKRGAKLGHFLSPAQRSLYNVPRLKGKPWWNVEDTPYVKLARALEKSWREILKEGLAAQTLYEKEKEGLKERGEWSQLDLFVRGQEIPGRCKQAPVTCSVVNTEAAAAGCRRGQIKFSAMAPGTHVRPHVGPTNCRLRMHLGLSNTKDTYLRVDKETRQWQEGKVLLFDDSFEHEVWHNGTGERLVLIVDLWHPDLTPAERRQLPAI